MTTGRLFVVPVINTMGPVIDPRHDDLLNTWEDVDRACARYFEQSYRGRYPDSRGRPAVFSWFFISWSGFSSNPVHREFGWFNVYDHYHERFGAAMDKFGDRLHWMYNHPPASGVGNEWGLDWLHNSQYFEILDRYLLERAYFPSVIEVATERNDTSHWIEQWFPFDVGNRNCRDLNLGATEADGRKSGSVLDWGLAPDDWSEYHPSAADYRVPGDMRRWIFRLLDIKTRIYRLRAEEIEKAFRRCRAGRDTFLSAYEHDFRDRSHAVSELLLEPVSRIARDYPDVEWRYADALEAAQEVTHVQDRVAPDLRVEVNEAGIRIHTSEEIFGAMPYVASKDLTDATYRHHPAARVGENTWQISRDAVPSRCLFAAAASDRGGNVGMTHVTLEGTDVRDAATAARQKATLGSHGLG